MIKYQVTWCCGSSLVIQLLLLNLNAKTELLAHVYFRKVSWRVVEVKKGFSVSLLWNTHANSCN